MKIKFLKQSYIKMSPFFVLYDLICSIYDTIVGEIVFRDYFQQRSRSTREEWTRVKEHSGS